MADSWLNQGGKKRQRTGLVGETTELERRVIESTPEDQIVMLDLDKIRVHEFNRLTGLDEAHIVEMAELISRKGQLNPMLVVRDWGEDDRYVLIGGHYRRAALQRLNRQQGKAIILPIEQKTERAWKIAITNLLMADNVHMPVSFMDRVLLAEKLHEEGWPVEVIATIPMMGTETMVRTMLEASALPDEIKRIFKERELGAGYARVSLDIAKFGQAAMRKLVRKLKQGATEKELERMLLALQAAKPKERKNAPRVLMEVDGRPVCVVRKTHAGARLEIECDDALIEEWSKSIEAMMSGCMDEIAEWVQSAVKREKRKKTRKEKV